VFFIRSRTCSISLILVSFKPVLILLVYVLAACLPQFSGANHSSYHIISYHDVLSVAVVLWYSVGQILQLPYVKSVISDFVTSHNSLHVRNVAGSRSVPAAANSRSGHRVLAVRRFCNCTAVKRFVGSLSGILILSYSCSYYH